MYLLNVVFSLMLFLCLVNNFNCLNIGLYFILCIVKLWDYFFKDFVNFLLGFIFLIIEGVFIEYILLFKLNLLSIFV